MDLQHTFTDKTTTKTIETALLNVTAVWTVGVCCRQKERVQLELQLSFMHSCCVQGCREGSAGHFRGREPCQRGQCRSLKTWQLDSHPHNVSGFGKGGKASTWPAMMVQCAKARDWLLRAGGSLPRLGWLTADVRVVTRYEPGLLFPVGRRGFSSLAAALIAREQETPVR